ncbi:MAG: alpha/beta fold hydrolase [Chloroflexota bacterium]
MTTSPLFRPPAAPSELPQTPAAETCRLTVGGIAQRVLVAGTGDPLVLLHGLGGSADEWLSVLPALAERSRVIAPDAPGHGFSEKPPCRDGHRYDLGYYTTSVLGVMDALGVRQAPLVAVSGGGPVALSIALAHPDRVSKLVLVDVAGLGREVAWSYRIATLPLMHLALRRRDRRSIERFGRALCYDPDRLPEGWVDHRLEIWATPGAVEAFFATVRAGLSLLGQKVDFTARLGEVRQPTLLIWGRQDPTVPVAHAIAAHRALPNSQLRIFDECGHMPMWEYPEAFAQTVLDFLDR